jgi:hypothetical protein
MATDFTTTISTVTNIFKNLFKVPTPLQPISKEEILIGSKFREGLSAIDIASKIIERKKEIGIGIGPLPSGSENIELQMEIIRVEEIVNALLTKAKVEIAIPPGTQITASGGNAGGPIVVQGATITISKGEGIIR